MTFDISKIRITKLNNGFSPGEIIPDVQDMDNTGNMGRLFEDILRHRGYDLQSGAGPDLHQMKIEIKSRNICSSSSHTICTMPGYLIKQQPYEKTLFYQKIQKQYRIEYERYNHKSSIIREARIYDFSSHIIQDKLKKGYEYLQNELINQPNATYLSCEHGYGILEKVPGSKDSFYYRLSDKCMAKIKRLSTSKFESLFVNPCI